jgi:nitroreductase
LTVNKIIKSIFTRRSVSPKRLKQPAPGWDELIEIIGTAGAAPDHGRMAPVRFVLIPGDERESMAAVFESVAKGEGKLASDYLEDVRSKAMNGAMLVAIIAKISELDNAVPPHEQWISVGASLQNVLLALESFGYRGKIVSGRRVRSNTMRQAFRLKPEEHLVGFVVMGTFSGATRDYPRKNGHDLLSIWSSSQTLPR